MKKTVIQEVIELINNDIFFAKSKREEQSLIKLREKVKSLLPVEKDNHSKTFWAGFVSTKLSEFNDYFTRTYRI